MAVLPRHSGLLSRLPRNPSTMGDEDECFDVSALQAHADGPTIFGRESRYRAKARESFVRWDCGERVRRATLRKGRTCDRIIPSWRHSFVLQRTTSRWTRIAMECRIEIDWFREGQKQPRWKRNHATPYSSALPLIVYVRARLQNCWLSTTRKPNILHISQQMLRHNKVSSMNVLHLLTHHGLSMMIETMRCQSQHKRRAQRSEMWTIQPRELMSLLAHNHFVTCNFITTWCWNTWKAHTFEAS